MVAAAVRFTLAAGAALCLVSPLSAKDLAAYRVGDIAERDIVAPASLVVPDADATAALRRKEAERAPVIMRFFSGAAEEVENSFRAATSSAPSNACLARLREAMTHPVRADRSPNGFAIGNGVRLVTVTNLDEALTLEVAERRGTSVSRPNIVTLSRARANFLESVPSEEQALASLAASLLKPNCVIDSELTRQSRVKRTEQIFAADRYSGGQIICRRGQVIDRKIMAALTQLEEKAVVAQLQQRTSEQTPRTGQTRSPTRPTGGPDRWLLAGLGGVVLVLVLVLWRLARLRQSASLLPARIPAGNVATLPADSWQRRAPVAKQRTEEAHAAIYASMLPHLAHLLKITLVRGLIFQRSSLLNAQQTAVAEMAELERRLDELQAPLQERLSAYEKRIAELEKALAAKGEENRELIKAKIQLAKQQLVAQRTKSRIEFN